MLGFFRRRPFAARLRGGLIAVVIFAVVTYIPAEGQKTVTTEFDHGTLIEVFDEDAKARFYFLWRIEWGVNSHTGSGNGASTWFSSQNRSLSAAFSCGLSIAPVSGEVPAAFLAGCDVSYPVKNFVPLL
jgi:hypothetical protein